GGVGDRPRGRRGRGPAGRAARRRRGAGVRAAVARRHLREDPAARPGPGAAAPRPGRGGRRVRRAERGRAAAAGHRLRRAGQRLRPGSGPAAGPAGGARRHPGPGGVGPAPARPGRGARGAPGHPERVGGALILVKAGPGASRLATASRGAQELRRRWRAGAVTVTLGGDGALLCHAGSTPLVVPAPASAEGDTCGAGDRFAAAAAIALSRGALVSEAVQAAVTEASAYVAAGGVAAALPAPPRTASAPPSRPGGPRIGAGAAAEVVARVRAAGGTVVATGGCFDLLHAGHVATLEAARQLGDCLVVCVNSDASVAGLKGSDRPVVPQGDRSRLLAALGCVDAVLVFDEPTPEAALTWLRPDVWVKGGDYAGGGEPALPEAEVLRRWGGHTVVVPYLDGRSTTDMIAVARAGGVPAGPRSRVLGVGVAPDADGTTIKGAR
ncbi:LOW QUALITY PROTEIN: cytidyltransferase, partial [Micromonospora sp. ATCC 39149]